MLKSAFSTQKAPNNAFHQNQLTASLRVDVENVRYTNLLNVRRVAGYGLGCGLRSLIY